MKNILIVLCTVLILASSCKRCYDISEPSIFLRPYGSFHYRQFYGIGGKDTLPWYGYLPVAINSDTSVYILMDSAVRDTLAISYQRIVKYQSEECGFAVRLDSFKLLDVSTFDSASFNSENYEVTLYR